jgi:hypothetical protein
METVQKNLQRLKKILETTTPVESVSYKDIEEFNKIIEIPLQNSTDYFFYLFDKLDSPTKRKIKIKFEKYFEIKFPNITKAEIDDFFSGIGIIAKQQQQKQKQQEKYKFGHADLPTSYQQMMAMPYVYELRKQEKRLLSLPPDQFYPEINSIGEYFVEKELDEKKTKSTWTNYLFGYADDEPVAPISWFDEMKSWKWTFFFILTMIVLAEATFGTLWNFTFEIVILILIYIVQIFLIKDTFHIPPMYVFLGTTAILTFFIAVLLSNYWTLFFASGWTGWASSMVPGFKASAQFGAFTALSTFIQYNYAAFLVGVSFIIFPLKQTYNDAKLKRLNMQVTKKQRQAKVEQQKIRRGERKIEKPIQDYLKEKSLLSQFKKIVSNVSFTESQFSTFLRESNFNPENIVNISEIINKHTLKQIQPKFQKFILFLINQEFEQEGIQKIKKVFAENDMSLSNDELLELIANLVWSGFKRVKDICEYMGDKEKKQIKDTLGGFEFTPNLAKKFSTIIPQLCIISPSVQQQTKLRKLFRDLPNADDLRPVTDIQLEKKLQERFKELSKGQEQKKHKPSLTDQEIDALQALMNEDAGWSPSNRGGAKGSSGVGLGLGLRHRNKFIPPP